MAIVTRTQAVGVHSDIHAAAKPFGILPLCVDLYILFSLGTARFLCSTLHWKLCLSNAHSFEFLHGQQSMIVIAPLQFAS